MTQWCSDEMMDTVCTADNVHDITAPILLIEQLGADYRLKVQCAMT